MSEVSTIKLVIVFIFSLYVFSELVSVDDVVLQRLLELAVSLQEPT